MHTNRGDFYGETFLSVVSEAVYTGTEMFFTEKLLKPIWNLHPFILVSTPYCLKKLQEQKSRGIFHKINFRLKLSLITLAFHEFGLSLK